MKNVKEVVLEPSSNTHKMSASDVVVSEITPSILKLKVSGSGYVTHGEHGTLVTESETVLKYVQQEYNPVTKAMQNAFD